MIEKRSIRPTCLMLIPLFSPGCSAGVNVTITNNSGSTISDLRIIYSGGSFLIKTLEPNISKRLLINPKGESDTKLEFKDPRGTKFKETIEVYIEEGYSGSLDITIGPDGKVTWVDKIE